VVAFSQRTTLYFEDATAAINVQAHARDWVGSTGLNQDSDLILGVVNAAGIGSPGTINWIDSPSRPTTEAGSLGAISHTGIVVTSRKGPNLVIKTLMDGVIMN
jgi:hypothetical protein